MNHGLIGGSVGGLRSRPRHLACAETWASNNSTASLVELPGLTAWVHSVPVGPGHAGGDVHYVSVCPDCIVSRVALADVSGHGQAVAAFGQKLQELMQRHLRSPEQIALMRELNKAVCQQLGDGHYATMVAIGWDSRDNRIVMTNAGHPPPLFYRASCDEWIWLEMSLASGQHGPIGVPLGLLSDAEYDQLIVRPQLGDVIVLYSDGVSEATDPGGKELGRDGLTSLLRALDVGSAEAVGSQLVTALQSFRGDQERNDDETIIVLRRSAP